jgi:hypothetical protein
MVRRRFFSAVSNKPSPCDAPNAMMVRTTGDKMRNASKDVLIPLSVLSP